jgi:PilZ domain
MEPIPPAAGSTPAPEAAAPQLLPGVRLHLRDHSGPICVSEVAAVRPDALAVRLLDPAPKGAFAEGAAVDVSVAGASGLFRSTTTVTGPPGVDALLDLHPPETFTHMQRRAHPRAPVALAVTARRVLADGLGDEREVALEDLSRGGMRLADERGDLQVGHVMQVELPIDTPPVRLRGLVVATRSTEEGRSVHVAFSSASDAALARLERYVGDRLGRPAS